MEGISGRCHNSPLRLVLPRLPLFIRRNQKTKKKISDLPNMKLVIIQLLLVTTPTLKLRVTVNNKNKKKK